MNDIAAAGLVIVAIAVLLISAVEYAGRED